VPEQYRVTGALKYPTADAQSYMDGYAELHRAFRQLEEAADNEGEGSIPIEELSRLTYTKNELGTMLKIPVVSMERALGQLKRGEGRPLQEVRIELHRRLGA